MTTTYEFRVTVEMDGENGGVLETMEQERLACVALEDALGSMDFPEADFLDICPVNVVVLHPKRQPK